MSKIHQQLYDKLSKIEERVNMPNADRFAIMRELRNSYRHDALLDQLVREVLMDPNKPDVQPLFHFGDISALLAALKDKYDIID